jgi:hypothetical protein
MRSVVMAIPGSVFAQAEVIVHMHAFPSCVSSGAGLWVGRIEAVGVGDGTGGGLPKVRAVQALATMV